MKEFTGPLRAFVPLLLIFSRLVSLRWLSLSLALCIPLYSAPGGSIGVIAHRGASLEAPENTLPAIQRAIDLGCHYAEVDVRLTRDGRVVLLHDATLERTTTGGGKVADRSYAEVRRLDAGVNFSDKFRGARIPLLEEAIALARGKINLYLDLKTADPEPVVRVVRRLHFSSSVYYRPYSLAALEKVRSLDPQGHAVLGLSDYPRMPEPVEALLQKYPGVIVGFHLSDPRIWILEQARQQGTRVFIDSVGPHDTAENLKRAVALQPAAIQTDHPAWLLDILNDAPTVDSQKNTRLLTR